MEITERWLGEIAGWQVLKAARSIVERGLVSESRREGEDIKGLVTEGPKRYQSGLLVRTRTDVDNLCTCPTSRGRGLICGHSIAVALTLIQKPIAPAQFPRRDGIRPTAHPSTLQHRAASIEPPISSIQPTGRFTFYLPDNLLDASYKGQAAVFMRFESGPNGEATDGKVSAWLRSQGVKPGSMPLMLTRNDLSALFNALGGHHSVFSGKPSTGAPHEDARLGIADAPLRLPVIATEDNADVAFTIDSESVKRVANHWCYCSATRSFFALPSISEESKQLVIDLFEQSTTTRTLAWLVRNRSALDETMQMRLLGPHLSQLHLVPLPCEFELQLDGSMQAVEAKLFATFNQVRWLAMEGTPDEVNGVKFPLEATDHIGRFYARNLERERGATERLFDLGFQPISSTTWRLQGADKVARFYASDLPRLQRVFKIDQSERWKTSTRGILRITPKVNEPKDDEPKRSNDWLSLDIAYEAPDGFRISRADVMQLIRTGRRSMTGKDGKHYLLDSDACEEFEESLRDLDSEMTTTGVRVRADKAQFLFATDDESFAERQAASWQSEAWIKEQLPDLAVLLRPYQLDGIRWLEASARGAKAGLLADDMGLGKTLQAIALTRLIIAQPYGSTSNEPQRGSPRIAGGRMTPGNSERESTPEGLAHEQATDKVPARIGEPLQDSASGGAPALIVCPKSLIANWEREFERFAPSLKVLAIHGSDRHENFARLSDYDAIITTYQLVVRDLTQHRKQTYAALILDEASQIRNPDTEAAKALRAVKAECRFALTGTPVENSVRDLWSIYQFLLPGYLGSKDSFKDRFEKPLANGVTTPEARKTSERLRKLVRPYFLRRTKKEVLKDLPEKIEQVLWCDLSKPQMEVYRRLQEEGLNEVRDARRRGGKGGAKMTMFTVLLRLRQVCCDLRMTGVNPDAIANLSTDDLSGKLAVWRERLEEIMSNGGKVLIFSQFVKFLHLLREDLAKEKIDHCYLDGQSNDRGAQVERFQKDANARVFLISLKAGGYGLNLTAADHVMLMDPWWNPAVEAQAIDRAHRMGQDRVVTALRLVTRGTVEEKILKLQSQKRGLIEAALDDGAPMMTGLTEEDLEDVLTAAL